MKIFEDFLGNAWRFFEVFWRFVIFVYVPGKMCVNMFWRCLKLFEALWTHLENVFVCFFNGPRVAENWFSAKIDRQFRGRHSDPWLGYPFRGHSSFLKVTPMREDSLKIFEDVWRFAWAACVKIFWSFLKICEGFCVCSWKTCVNMFWRFVIFWSFFKHFWKRICLLC